MKKIPLTRGRVALVDNADYEWLNQWKWSANRGDSRYSFYAVRRITVAKYKQTVERMHRLILGLQRDDKRQCDHRDSNGLNNQRSNLRVCTPTQNSQSRRKRRGCTSKYKGIWWCSDARKWQSGIRVNKKLIHLGYFGSEKLAATTYNQAALKYFGEFALLNTF